MQVILIIISHIYSKAIARYSKNTTVKAVTPTPISIATTGCPDQLALLLSFTVIWVYRS